MAATSPSRVPTETGCASERLTLREAAELGYGSVSTLRRYIDAGELRAIRQGRRIWLCKKDLDALCREPILDIALLVKQASSAAPPLTREQIRLLRGVFGGAL